MPKHVLFNASIHINSVDLSDHIESISWEVGINKQAAAGMGEIQDYDMPGTQVITDPAVTFYQDYDAAKVYQTMQPLFTARTVFNLVVKADTGAIATTNPQWTLPVFILKMPFVMGKHGDRHMAAATFAPAGLMTIATS